MFPLLSGLIGGAANLAGSYFSSQTSAQNTQAQIEAQQQMLGQTEVFNAGQSQIQRDYETQMSNTAYQRASKDMQAAGLNPMMMYGSGGASSTPGVGAASVGTPSVPSFQKTPMLGQLGPAVSQAVNSAIAAKTIDKLTEEVATQKALTGKTLAETATEEKRPEFVATATDVERQRASEIAQQRVIRTPSEIESVGASQLGEAFLKGAGKLKYITGSGSDILQPIINTATGVGRIGKAFQDLGAGALKSKIDRGNFIGKYGTPVDEYLAN